MHHQPNDDQNSLLYSLKDVEHEMKKKYLNYAG